MGILDDAIREHLELIRQRGAADSEVRRLEDEAFGPPTRPDEADFPESEDVSGNGNGMAAEAAPEEPEDLAAHEDATTLLPAEDVEEPVAEAPGTGLEEPTGAHITDDADDVEGEPVLGAPQEEPEPVAETDYGESTEEGPIAEEHAIVDEAPAEAAEEPPAADHATTFYDQGEDEGADDLELSLEDEGAPDEAPPSEEQPVEQAEGAMPLEPPIESLDTVEHPFPDEITEEPHEKAAPSEEPDEDVPPEDEGDGESAEAGDSGEGDEDVLADTPEFLKDQPEDDELWFEQGEPKDFDF